MRPFCQYRLTHLKTQRQNLNPHLPQAGEATAKKIGEDIYQALKTRFGKKPAAQETLNDLEKAPNEQDLQAALRVQLKKLLAEDEAFATQLQHLSTCAIRS